MNVVYRIALPIVLAALSGPVCASAKVRPAAPPAAATPAPRTSAPERDLGETPDSVTQHTVTIGGSPIAYTARAGTIALRDDSEKLTARMFYTAYTVDAPAPSRPVTFVYNGGPGSSTMWLRMGSFGPVRVQAADGKPSGPPPYRIVENPYSLLDKTDLVFIDMPDSGFGRIVGDKKAFFGVDQDVSAFGQFIQRYVTQFNRWNSPKFLFGESYGTTRSAALADHLQSQRGIALNGVILLSSILNFGLDYGNGDPIGGGDWAYVLYLPTEAATAWYHNRIQNRPADLPAYLRQVENFALGEYLTALERGVTLSSAQRNDVARKLSGYLGLSQQYVRNSNLRVPYSRFQSQMMRSSGQVIGRLDGRYLTYTTDRATTEGPPWDPTDSSIDAPYITAMNSYVRNDLRYDPPQIYRQNIYGIIYANGGSWDMVHRRTQPTNVAPDLAEAMTQNPNLKIFSANGYYDFATPFLATNYTLRHLNLAPSLQKNISYGYYEAGHMVYLNEASLARFKADLTRFYDSALAR